MKKQNAKQDVRPNGRIVIRRATASVLAGLMLMSSVPITALAENAAGEATPTQQVVASVVNDDASKADGNDAAVVNNDAAALAVADAAAAADSDAATADAKADDAKSAADDSKSEDASADADADAKADAKTEAKSDETKKEDEAKKSDDASAKKDEDFLANESTKVTRWSNYDGGSNDTLNALKTLGTAIGNAAGQKYGSAAVSLLGLFFGGNGVEYSTNDVMYKLYDMENKISGISSQVYSLQSSLDDLKTDNNYRRDLERIVNYDKMLCSNEEGVVPCLVRLNDALNKYREVGEDGKPTDTACSLTTPAERIPEQARNDAMRILGDLQYPSYNNTGKSFENMESTLYSLITDNSNNLVRDYFARLATKYNWDAETFSVKENYLAHVAQMYVNAYTVKSAMLRLRIADAKALGDDTASLEEQLKALGRNAAQVKVALFGEDGESGFAAETHAKDNKVYCYVNGQSYDKDTYACVSAYSPKCFEGAYAEGTVSAASRVISNWNIHSTFTTDQVADMVARLNVLREAGAAPKKADGTQVYGILEEMEALGFKNVKTDGNEQNTTWNERLPSHKGYSTKVPLLGVTVKAVTNSFVELGDSTKQPDIPEKNDYHLGTRLSNSSDYVVTEVTKPRLRGLKNTIIGDSDSRTNDSYCSYGTVVNVKTGKVIKDQLLYVLHNSEYGHTIYFSKINYYAFGALRMGTTDPSLDAIPV